MKRVLKKLVFGLLALLALTVIVGATWEQLARRAAARRFPAPGKLVDIGGRRIQLDCRGGGVPTVVLIHGLDVGGALSWSAVHDSIARTTRTCAYSRAGIMWSDPTPAFTPTGMVTDLHAALAAGGERPPFVLVGHSLGGPISLLYTKQHGDQVAGLVMVDASHPEQFTRFKELGISTENAAVRLLQVAAALSWTGVGRLLASQIRPMPNQAMDVALAQRAWAPRSIRGAITEMTAFDAIFAEAATARSLGDRPLVVLTAMKPMSAEERRGVGITEEQAQGQKKMWLEMHQEEMRWSTAGRQVVLPDASHYIQFDRPDVVTAAVVDVVAAVRGGGRHDLAP
ncbi:MAG: alpha/beta fold hydrolase [Gemmatimonadales bacterium]